MASAPIILYLCCWLARQSKVSGQLPAPGPSISVSPSGVIALGGAVTIRCQCRCEARRLFLYKGGLEIQELDADGDEGEFTIPSAKREDRGVYSCRSRSRTEPPNWSDPSNIVPIIVAELSYPKPSIFLSPNGGVTLGGAVTIQCWGQRQNVRFLLFKDGNPNTQQDTEPAGDLAEFSIRSVSRRDAGSYSCQYSTKWDPPVWSEPSDPVELVVAEGTDPAGTQQPDPPMTEPAGEGGTDPTQLGTAPAPTRPGSAGPGGSEPSAAPDLTRCIMAGVSATAAGLLLLLLAFLCYRSTRGRKGPDPRQSRESEAAATVYALVGEGKQLDVLPQEPDPEAEGLTYAELDHQGLQAKRGGPAPAPEPVLYAAINVSQGAHRQSPQGAGAPPHPHSVNPGGVIGATGQGALATRG
ncbi:leukocyte immunoglobulin-like receptor subfamily B member 5 isoform X2 [Chelonia mydas]|uniref:leukocyte immunoglobulin-like receptor subfamily B member 5 isoform X2 n=1 Tax=Chelonia mydas TaxID=8469 RepID=UPI001CA86BB8|nr:leukocyte immunoglobulin-like receptor subfamily B member 5 isoform X2 [Chelonia mydas]